MQGTGRAMGDALSAQGAAAVFQAVHIPHIDCCLSSGIDHIPDIGSLDMIADLDAAHTLDAFVVVADQRELA